MKKTLNFLRSMRFGIILLVLIALCSIAGSVIPQGREASFYVENYPRAHMLFFVLRLDNMFGNWYFVLMMLLLGLNLTLCSIVRVRSVAAMGAKLVPAAAAVPVTPAAAGEREMLEASLAKRGCRKTDLGTVKIYSKNLFGRYGSFITHLSILLTLIFGAAGLYLPQVTDLDCMPGETLSMPDGTEISVSSFYIENESGQLDFTSDITVTLPDGKTREGSIRVNYPLSNGPYKVYQQTYGTAGRIRVTNLENGGSDVFTLTEYAFLSLNGTDGVWYLTLYPDYIPGPDGSITPVPNAYGRYENPVYHVQLSEGGMTLQDLFLPGDEIELGGLRYGFEEPLEYPGLRIKYTPPIVNTLLFVSFGLMIIGLYITFFMQPVLVKIDDEGYAVSGPKPEAMRMDIRVLLDDYRKGRK